MDNLQKRLQKINFQGSGLEAELRQLERKFHDEVYSELLFLLSHQRFPPVAAREHWDRIVAHRRDMQEKLGSGVDIRVALVSYFLEINPQLKNPKIIELRQFEKTEASAYNDDLTGLCNFRFFREQLAREIERGQRYRTPISLVMADIDNFKLYNDQNGHETGNQALRAIADILKSSLRKVDVPARYGGEEFALILPSTSQKAAFQVAERARQRIDEHAFPRQRTQPGESLTISMGIATWPMDAGGMDELVRRADSAMYTAKARGKNQVHIYGEDRRTYPRIRAEINGEFCVLAAEYHPLKTVDISLGGLHFLVDRNLTLGSVIDIKLPLPGEEMLITSGRVVRVEEVGGGEVQAALRLLEMDEPDRDRLAHFIKTLQETGEAAEADPDKGPDRVQASDA